MYGDNANTMGGTNNISHTTYLRKLTSESSALNLSLWNQNFSIAISPATGRDANGVVQYDKNRQARSAISSDNAYVLVKKFNEDLLPEYERAIQTHTPCMTKSISVETSGQGKNVISITMHASQDPTDVTPIMELVLDIGVSPEGIVQPGNEARHVFSRKIFYKDYNANQGYREKEYVNTDFIYFLSILEAMGNSDVVNTVTEHLKKYAEERSKAFGGSNNRGGGMSAPQQNRYPANNGGYQGPQDLPFN